MLKYITGNEYIELLEAQSMPNNFHNLVIEASNYINHVTSGRIDEKNPSKQVKYVTCLIIELLSEKNKKLSEIGNLKSQNIEGWSESYQTPEEIKQDYENKQYEILKTFLSREIGIDGNPLLYCGVC